MRGAEKMRVLSLFAGIGRIDAGLEAAGMSVVQSCEQDSFCRGVLEKHWPGVECHEDIATLEPERSVDLVAAGFPCQDVSIANQSATGLAGERSGLYWHILRTVLLVGRPRILLENVAELLNRGMGAVLGSLASLGYDTQWHCIPASAIGAAQERDRVWIVADPSEERATRLLTSSDIGEARQRRASGQADLQQIADAPFERGDCHAEPLLRGMACRMPGRMDRVGACGNTVDSAIPELIGRAILASTAATDAMERNG